MTLWYEILKRIAKTVNIRRQMEMRPEEIIAAAKKQNAGNRIPQISDPAFEISEISVMNCPVLKMIHRERTGKACMFIIGGGMVRAPKPLSIKKALRFARQTGLDLYVPYYPLCTDYPVSRAYEMILATWREMLKDYSPENLSLFGTSSGGNLALGMIAYMNAEHVSLPRPGYIMAVSPGTCPGSEEEKKRMEELDGKDVAIPARYMLSAETIMRHGTEVPEYMIFLQKGDFTDCPKVTFIYGTNEVLYAIAPSFEAAMQKYDVPYEMIAGEGMFHCYPVFPLCQEAREGWKMMVRKMKENTSA